MSRRSRWEYFKAIYARYRQAECGSKHVILNQFCLNTGCHPEVRHPLAERPSSGPGAAPSATPARVELQSGSRVAAGGGVGGRRLSLVGAAESAVAALDVLKDS